MLWGKGTEIISESEGIIIERIGQGREKWNIIGVYVRESLERVLEGLEKWGEEKRERNTY